MSYVFIDWDNTLSDQFQFNTQYVREVAAILAPKFGGDPTSWEQATIDMLETIQEEYRARFVGRPVGDYSAWLDAMRVKSIEVVFRRLGVPMPPDPRQLAMETQFNALTSCDTSFPGAFDALMWLFENDYRTQMASANDSEWLLAALIGAGIESYTESKFGPDLVECAKEGPEFYERIFAASGVAASETVVIDDHPDAIAWAMQTGAKVIQAQLSTERHYPEVPGVIAVLTDLNDLPKLVKQAIG
jgi:FMN phosphatase YigB (HAD superfamily)